MIDLGLSKLIVIGIVALVVIGPDQLPNLARKLGVLLARVQHCINEVKLEISHQIELDNLRLIQDKLEKSSDDFNRSMYDVVRIQKTLDLSEKFQPRPPEKGLRNLCPRKQCIMNKRFSIRSSAAREISLRKEAGLLKKTTFFKR